MELDVNALDGKLNAVLERHSEEPIPSPSSLASTSSEALQYHSELCRDPLPADEQARRIEKNEQLLTQVWGDEQTRRRRAEKEEQDLRSLKSLAMIGWGLCESYEKEVSEVAKLRLAEDRHRDTSIAKVAIWTENDQRALEYQRQKEDHFQIADKLSLFLTGDENSESEKILRYRIRNLKTLLGLYDLQWKDSLERLQEDEERRRRQIPDLIEDEASNHDTEAQQVHQTTAERNEQLPLAGIEESAGPVQVSTVRKAVRRKRVANGRPVNVTRNISYSEPLLSPINNVTKSKTGSNHIALRRSERLQSPIPSKSKDKATTVPSGSNRRIGRSRRDSRVGNKQVTMDSAKPHGVSKPKPARKKLRKR